MARAQPTRSTDDSALARELKQGKPFESLEVETYLNLVRTNDQLEGNVARFLKQHGVSVPQYNVLRILRGAGPKGLPSLAVAERMVTRVPDITRLLDRLADRGWVTRARSPADGRVVLTRLVAKGRRLVARLDEPLVAFHREQFGHLSRKELTQLIELLEKARQA